MSLREKIREVLDDIATAGYVSEEYPSKCDLDKEIDPEEMMWVAVYPEDLEDHREEDGSMLQEWKTFEVWYGR